MGIPAKSRGNLTETLTQGMPNNILSQFIEPEFSFGLTSHWARKTKHSPLRDVGNTAVVFNNYKFQYLLTHSKAL